MTYIMEEIVHNSDHNSLTVFVKDGNSVFYIMLLNYRQKTKTCFNLWSLKPDAPEIGLGGTIFFYSDK